METQFPYQNQIAVVVGFVNWFATVLFLALGALSDPVGEDRKRVQWSVWIMAPCLALLLLCGEAVRDLFAIPSALFIHAQAAGIIIGMFVFMAGAVLYNYRKE